MTFPKVIIALMGIIIFMYLSYSVVTWSSNSYAFSNLLHIFHIRRKPGNKINILPTLPLNCKVKIQGKTSLATTISPVTRSESVFWLVIVLESKGGGKGGGYAEIIYIDKSTEPFEIIDDTGSILVHTPPEILPMCVNSNDSTGEDFDQIAQKYLDSKGLNTKGFFGFQKSLRIYEQWVSPQEEIYVLGNLRNDGQNRILASFISDPINQKLLISRSIKVTVLSVLFFCCIIGVFII